MGILFFAGLFAVCLITGGSFSTFGVRDEALEKLVFGSFFADVLWAQAAILLATLAVGWTLGAACGLFVSLSARALGRDPGRWTRRAFAAAALVALHALLTARSVAEYPQLYTEWFYDRGGWLAGLQVTITDLPLWVFDLALGLCAALFAAAALLAARRASLWSRIRVHLSALRGSRRGLAVVAAATVMGCAAFALWPLRAADEGPNILLIAVDSLRPDRLSAYGHTRPTPSIDRLAREGTIFDRAYSTLPRTFPAWTTLLTGQWPYRHGIRHMFPSRKERERAPTALPKALAAAGYRTSVVADYAGDIFTRMDYGFERVDAPTFNFPTLIALRSFEIHKQLLPYVTNGIGRRIFPVLRELAQNADPRDLGDRAVAELRRLASSGKFMLAVFFSATHFPYAAPSPYYRLYTDPAYAGPYRYHKFHELGRGIRLTAADVRQIQDLYDGAVRSVDDQVGRLLDALDDLGATRNTLVVLLSDHGEHLHDAGLGMGHGDHLRGDQAMRIPLVLRGPGIPAGRRVPGIVRDLDLAPTLYARLGLTPAAPVDGTDLAPLLAGQDDLGLEVYAETGLWFVDDGEEFFQRQRIPYPPLTELGRLDERHEVVVKERYRDLVLVAKHRMVQTKEHKLIYIPTRDGVRYELYDLARDPAQERDVAGKHPEVVGAMKAKLFRWMLGERGVHLRREFLLPSSSASGSPPVALEGGRGAGGG
jgi:arylsulfatase A-like enzyme